MPAPTFARHVAPPAAVLFQRLRDTAAPSRRRAFAYPDPSGQPRAPAPRRGARLPEPAMASYHELDVRFAWNAAPGSEASVTGRNLLHSEHPGFGPAATRLQVGRSVLFELSWRY